MDTVPLEDLEKLSECEAFFPFNSLFKQIFFEGHSEPLKNLLYNSHLRKLLIELDSSRDPERAISAAMIEPLFLEFADECLKLIEPEKENTENLDF